MHPRVAALIRELDLAPHAEGGHYRRVYASAGTVRAGGRRRQAMTAIRYLLQRGQASRWHRVDADELWHWQEGEALELLQFDATTRRLERTLLGAAQRGLPPMQVVPAGTWQAARPAGDYALACCVVSPGFEWEGFELLQEEDPVACALAALGLLDPAAGPGGRRAADLPR